MKSITDITQYIAKHNQWEEELTCLREIVLSTSLQETIKWGAPVYTVDSKNVIGLGAFKSYVGIWFFQGALLNDSKKKLINAQENKTKALRQWRFKSYQDIKNLSELIKEYILEAISNQKQGKFIKPDRNKPLIVPSELRELLSENIELTEKYSELTKSKQREFAEYISEAKRTETRYKRLDKIEPLILQGIGLNDKYKR